MEGGLTLYLTLENNEYQLYVLKYVSNIVQKSCNLLLGGRVLKDRIGSQGGRGGQDRTKKRLQNI